MEPAARGWLAVWAALVDSTAEDLGVGKELVELGAYGADLVWCQRLAGECGGHGKWASDRWRRDGAASGLEVEPRAAPAHLPVAGPRGSR